MPSRTKRRPERLLINTAGVRTSSVASSPPRESPMSGLMKMHYACFALSALLHDIGKPASRRWSDEKKDWTFHGHEVIGARMAKKILNDLRIPNETATTVISLIRWHMFFSDPDEVTLSAVRRIITNVGTEHIKELLNLRICDRIGTGRPKEQPFRFRKYMSMVDEAMRDPISVAMLKIDGSRIIKLGQEAGPRIGWVISVEQTHALLSQSQY